MFWLRKEPHGDFVHVKGLLTTRWNHPETRPCYGEETACVTKKVFGQTDLPGAVASLRSTAYTRAYELAPRSDRPSHPGARCLDPPLMEVMDWLLTQGAPSRWLFLRNRRPIR